MLYRLGRSLTEGIQGTFGPIGSAFSICALAPRWRVTVGPDQSEDNGDTVPDPPWLIGINALSLVLALTANVALLFNMARRLDFSIAQPITIVGWYVAAFLLIGLIVAASHAPSMQLPPEANPALTGAFYYAVMAAGIYIVVASLMAVTAWGAYRGRYSKTFQLTNSQRTLMLQTIAYLVYMLGGAAVYAHIEDWLFLNGVWWANYTLLTIGIGDFQVVTNLGKGLLFPYAILGIVVLGLLVGSIRSLVLERGKEKLTARLVEKKRERVLRKMSESDDEIKASKFSKPVKIGADGQSEGARRMNEFQLMRKIQWHADVRRKWVSLSISIFAWLVLWFVGAAVFYVAERDLQGMTYFEAVYFTYTSLLTIGYGDYTLLSNSGKAAFVFWSLLAVPTLTILISNMGDTVIKGIRDLTIWLGAFTVLPGDESVRDKLKVTAKRATSGKNGRQSGKSNMEDAKASVEDAKASMDEKKQGSDENDEPSEEPPGGIFFANQNRDVEKGHEKKQPQHTPSTATTRASDRLGGAFEREELDEAKDAGAHGDRLTQDTHLYHYLLMKEIRKVMKDVGEDPPKKYGYADWAYFMRLLGEDERDPRFHRKPPMSPPTSPPTTTEPGSGGSARPAEAHEGSAEGASGDREDDTAQSAAPSTGWSWVGEKSPLMGADTEPEWVLERLSERLEGQLRAERDKARGEGDSTQGDRSPGARRGLPSMKSPTTIAETLDEES